MRAVLDAGPVIHLSWIDQLDLLDALFEGVFLPVAVRNEVMAAPPETPDRTSIAISLMQGRLRIYRIQTALP
jgi:predicted nucleic acid-binding protein